MTLKQKICPLYFYKPNVGVHGTLPQIEEELCDFFKEHGRSNPTFFKTIGGYKTQLQNIVDCVKMRSTVGGVVKKFIDPKFLKQGIAGKAAERDIILDKDNMIIEKTYFLYDFSRHILLYQRNQSGTSCSRFGEYLGTQFGEPADVEFDVIPTHKSYDKFLRGHAELKRVDLRFPPPTARALLKRIKTPWVKEYLAIMAGLGGDTILTLNAKAKYGNKHLGEKRGIYELLNCFYKLLSDTPDTSGMKAKIKVDEDGTIHPIDLVMDRLSDEVDILKEGVLKEDNAIIADMEDIFIKKGDELKRIFG